MTKLHFHSDSGTLHVVSRVRRTSHGVTLCTVGYTAAGAEQRYIATDHLVPIVKPKRPTPYVDPALRMRFTAAQ